VRGRVSARFLVQGDYVLLISVGAVGTFLLFVVGMWDFKAMERES